MMFMLKPGGYLINFGPLLYHFEDSSDGPSVEMTWVELRHAMVALGFVIVVGWLVGWLIVLGNASFLFATSRCMWRDQEETYPLEAGYITNLDSMMQLTYQCVLCVAQKPLN